MPANNQLKPKVLTHEKLHFETQISGNGSGDNGCGDDGGWSGGVGNICPCIPIVIDFAKIKGLPNNAEIINTINSFGELLQKTKEGRFLLKRLYEMGPKLNANQEKEDTAVAILNGVTLIQAGKIAEAKSYIYQALTKLELTTI